jgi:hypothetical protein
MIVNVMEHHVIESYDRLKHAVQGFLDSAEHREDVVVYALNRLPPKYVVTEAGKAVTEALMEETQQRTAIDVKVLDALKQVALSPRRAFSHPPEG